MIDYMKFWLAKVLTDLVIIAVLFLIPISLFLFAALVGFIKEKGKKRT